MNDKESRKQQRMELQDKLAFWSKVEANVRRFRRQAAKELEQFESEESEND